MKYFKLKFLLLFFALAAALPPAWAGEVTDVIDINDTGSHIKGIATSTWVTNFTITESSGAEYLIHSMGCDKSTNYALRWNSNGYLYATKSGGKLKSITIKGFESKNKKVNVYTSNTAYDAAPSGNYTVQLTIPSEDTAPYAVTHTFEGNDSFIAIKGVDKSTLIASITIVWETEGGETPVTVGVPTFSYGGETVTGDVEVYKGETITITSAEGTVLSYTTDDSDPAESNTAILTDDNTAVVTINANCIIKAIALDDDLNVSEVATLNVTAVAPPEPSGIIYEKVSSIVDGGTYVVVYEGAPAAMGEIAKITNSGTKGSAVTGILLNTTTNPYQVDLAGKTALLLKAHAGDEAYAFEIIGTSNYLGIDGASFSQPETASYVWTMDNEGHVTGTGSNSTRALIYRDSQELFGPYASSNVNDTEYFYAYLYKLYENTPEPVEAELSYTQTEFTVYADADFTAPELVNPHNLTVTYSSSDENVAKVNETTGEVELMGKAGKATIMATSAATDEYLAGSASYTITVEARPVLVADEKVEFETTVGTSVEKTFTVMGENLKGDITLTLADETGMFSINPPTIAKDAMTDEGVVVTVTYAPTAEDIHEATVTLSSKDAENVTVSLIGMATEPEQVATPTFSLVAGSYTGQQPLTISCETADAVISYSTDGGNNWTEGNTLTLTEDVTVMAKATKAGSLDSEVAVAAYIIDIPAELPSIEPLKGYYSIKNNGNGKYANVAGRRTLTFAEQTADKAGTVIYVETNDKGQVQSLRSQGADLQGYANKAMKYVPELVQLVVDKLHAEGSGNILGENGLNAIMAKFNESFDHHLYVEAAGEGYRLYGKTPSMQPVVDFYRENKANVEAKLPMLVDFINSAIAKLRNKANQAGMNGDSVFVDFDLQTIWQRMGGTLTKPADDASTMAFYREVLNNKNYVWDFAYQTATLYLEKVKATRTYQDMLPELGEFGQYLDKLEQIRPDFKYYVAQKDDKPDFISQGNTDIINNNERAIWTLEPRAEFQVNIPAENKYGAKSYATTLYTDFAYTTPEGVVAYKVTDVDELGYAKIAKIDGIVPAQTPVMIMDTTGVAGVKTLTITTEAGAPVNDNLLVGPDYLIGKYKIKAQTVASLFGMVKSLLGENFYNSYMLQYEHLMLRYAGTVNNKYFWGISEDDVLDNCIVDNKCEVRNLGMNDKGEMVFTESTIVATNKAFLVSDKFTEIKLSLRGDVNRNGEIEIGDVSALIDILLTLPERPYDPQYDYIAADFDENGEIAIKDVSALIDYLLHVTY